MSFDKTNKCFFTQKSVISNDEPDGSCLDGYYYMFDYNGTIREIRLDSYTDWENNDWVKKNGLDFIRLIDKIDKWSFFDDAHNIDEIIEFYFFLKTSEINI